jgi:alkylation response protein AidB-like acyl-CoA dehydrogenase
MISETTRSIGLAQLHGDDIEAIRDSVIRFMEGEVVPVMDQWEARKEMPRELVRKAGALGLFGSLFPESVGGTNTGYMAGVVILEEMARQDVRFACCSNQQSGTCPASIYLAGTQKQIDKYVPRLIAGETIGLMSLTEAGGGSDALGNMRTTAKRDGDVYRLNGSKMWASLGNETDAGVLLAKTDPNAGAKGVTAFIVEPKKYPGFTAKPIDTMGLSRSFRTCALYLDDFVVPVENRLGEEGEGFKIIMRALESGRAVVGALAMGIARACYEDAVRYANERFVRGSPLGKYQMIQSDIAEMAVAIEASRALLYKTAQHMDAGLPTNRLASIAKYHVSQTAKLCADKAQQIFGGYGLATEYRVSRYKCFADMMFTGEGSANVQKIIIAEDALGYKSADRHHAATGLRQLGRH